MQTHQYHLSTRPDISLTEITFVRWLLYNHPEGCNLPTIFKTFSPEEFKELTPNAKYHKLRRMLYKLSEDLSLISLEKDNGLLWASPKGEALDLIKQVQKSNFAKGSKENFQQAYPPKRKSPYTYPSRCKPQRIEAIKKCDTHKMLTAKTKAQVADHFFDYLEETSNLKIVMKPYSFETFPDPLILDYVTRFDPERTGAIYQKYMHAWDLATQQHTKGVFLTLTTDPKRFGSVWRSARHFQIAWNRFMSFLSRRLGHRPHYIAAFEFSKSGLLHVHVVLFVPYLAAKDHITREWMRCGQGMINYLYAIKNDNGKWTWTRKKPQNATTHHIDPKDYLSKYLRKSLYPQDDDPEAYEEYGRIYSEKKDMVQCLYWTINKRFFTCSRIFLVPSDPPSIMLPRFFFVGTCHFLEIDTLLYRFAKWQEKALGVVY